MLFRADTISKALFQSIRLSVLSIICSLTHRPLPLLPHPHHPTIESTPKCLLSLQFTHCIYNPLSHLQLWLPLSKRHHLRIHLLLCALEMQHLVLCSHLSVDTQHPAIPGLSLLPLRICSLDLVRSIYIGRLRGPLFVGLCHFTNHRN